jgi:hypothetical protein
MATFNAGVHTLPKNLRSYENSKRQSGDKKQSPRRGTTKLGNRENILVGDRAPEKSASLV